MVASKHGGGSTEIDDLALFLAVVRCGSITRAAETFGFNQSTVSRRLQRLEAELGTPLLNRGASPLTPTEAGREFLRFAMEVVERRQVLQERLGRPDALRGELRVAASSAPAARVAPRLISDFLARYPDVRPRLQVMSTRAVEEAVASQRVAVGFTGSRPHNLCLLAYPVGRDEILLVVPRGPRYDDLPDPLPAARLAELPFVERDEGSATLDTVRHALEQAGWTGEIHVALEVDSAEAALAAVAAGVGATFVSGALLARNEHQGIRALTVADVNLARPLFVIVDPVMLSRDPVASRFHQFVLDRVRGTA